MEMNVLKWNITVQIYKGKSHSIRKSPVFLPMLLNIVQHEYEKPTTANGQNMHNDLSPGQEDSRNLRSG